MNDGILGIGGYQRAFGGPTRRVCIPGPKGYVNEQINSTKKVYFADEVLNLKFVIFCVPF